MFYHPYAALSFLLPSPVPCIYLFLLFVFIYNIIDGTRKKLNSILKLFFIVSYALISFFLSHSTAAPANTAKNTATLTRNGIRFPPSASSDLFEFIPAIIRE